MPRLRVAFALALALPIATQTAVAQAGRPAAAQAGAETASVAVDPDAPRGGSSMPAAGWVAIGVVVGLAILVLAISESGPGFPDTSPSGN